MCRAACFFSRMESSREKDVVRAGGEAEPLLFQDGLVAGFQLGDNEHVFNDVQSRWLFWCMMPMEFAGQGRLFPP